MPSPAAAPMTADQFAEFCALPEHAERNWELLSGEIVEVSRPGDHHNRLMYWITFLFHRFTDQRGRGTFNLGDVGLRLADHTVVGPDVLIFDRTQPLRRQWFQDPPELAVEIVSDNDRYPDVARKIDAYLTAGVLAVWLVDPDLRQVVVHLPGGGRQYFRRGDTLAGPGPLADLRIAVDELFAFPGAPA